VTGYSNINADLTSMLFHVGLNNVKLSLHNDLVEFTSDSPVTFKGDELRVYAGILELNDNSNTTDTTISFTSDSTDYLRWVNATSSFTFSHKISAPTIAATSNLEVGANALIDGDLYIDYNTDSDTPTIFFGDNSTDVIDSHYLRWNDSGAVGDLSLKFNLYNAIHIDGDALLEGGIKAVDSLQTDDHVYIGHSGDLISPTIYFGDFGTNVATTHYIKYIDTTTTFEISEELYLGVNKMHHAGDFTVANVASGVTANGWGNHASAGYGTAVPGDIEWRYVGTSTDLETATQIDITSTDLGESFDWANYDYKFVYTGATNTEDNSVPLIRFDNISATDKYSYQYSRIQQTAETTEAVLVAGDSQTTGITTGLGLAVFSDLGYATILTMEFTVSQSELNSAGFYFNTVRGFGSVHYLPSSQSLTTSQDGLCQTTFIGAFKQDGSAITTVNFIHNHTGGNSDRNKIRVYKRLKGF